MTANYKTITETPGWLNRLTDDGVPDSNATLYAQVPYLFRLVQLRCDTLSSVPLKIYQIDDDEEQNEQEWPYPTSLTDLLWKWEASALLAGAAYGEIVSNDNSYAKDVKYRNPFDMNVTYEKGVIVVKQNSSGMSWRNDITKGEYEIVYLAEFDPSQDLLPGVGAGKAANMDAKLLYALAKFPEAYFEGGAMPVTLLGIDSTDKGEIKRVETWFQRSATAIKNAFRVLGIRAGSITPTTLTPPLKDLTMPELNNEAKDNLSVAFGVPKSLMDSEAANYATAKEDRKSFYEETIMPRARKFESVLNEQLLARDNLRLEFTFNELEIFQENENERADLLKKYVEAGMPLRLAMDKAGLELTEDQEVLLDDHQEERSDERDEDPESPFVDELGKWYRFAEKRISEGRDLREFETDIIPAALHGAITGALETVKTVDEVKRIFDQAKAWEGYP